MTDNLPPRKERDWAPNRTHAIILAVIMLIGLARGAYWVFTIEVWSQIDEAQHYSYVEMLARGHGMPVVGEDKVSRDILQVAKDSPTLPFQPGPFSVDDVSQWGPFGYSYEGGGVQGPFYYAVLVPVYWVSHPFGTPTAIFALRMASVVISLAAVPLLWLLAKRLLPGLPQVWLAAPALMVLVQGFNSNVASLTNDALVLPICIAALLPIVDGLKGLQPRQAVIGGLLFGAAMLTKPLSTPVAVYVGLVLLWLLLTRRETLPTVFRWGAIYAGVTIAVMVPYVAWNFAHYGAYSASEEVNAITGPVQERLPFSIDSMKAHLHNARVGFWDFQPLSLGTHSDYNRLFQWTAVAAALAGLAVALLKRDIERGAMLVWFGLAFPIAFGLKIFTNYAFVDNVGSVVGRHLYTSLGLVMLAITAGLTTALGPRLALAALLAIAGFALISEREGTNHYIEGTYTLGVLPGSLAPAFDQPYAAEFADVSEVQYDPPCPALMIALRFKDSPVAAVNVAGQGPAPHFGTIGPISFYQLPRPEVQPFRVQPGAPIGVDPARDVANVSIPGSSGDPVTRLYCKYDDPLRVRFDQLYRPIHPDFSYPTLRAWPTAWYWAGWVMLAGSAAAGAYVAYDNLRRRTAPPA